MAAHLAGARRQADAVELLGLLWTAVCMGPLLGHRAAERGCPVQVLENRPLATLVLRQSCLAQVALHGPQAWARGHWFRRRGTVQAEISYAAIAAAATGNFAAQ